MNRAEKFTRVVQVGIQTVLLAVGPHHFDYLKVISRAVRIPEDVVPEDFEAGAREYLEWSFGGGKEPEWHAAWQQGATPWT
jgi:hypothetical protein